MIPDRRALLQSTLDASATEISATTQPAIDMDHAAQHGTKKVMCPLTLAALLELL